MVWTRVLLVVFFANFLGSCWSSNNVEVNIGTATLKLEVASTDEQRAKGLMGRMSLAEGRGMIFVFKNERMLSFWMKDTLIPLSIAYVDAEGVIVDLLDMHPQKENEVLKVYESSRPVRYAIEVPIGWFQKNQIKEGDRIVIPSQLHKSAQP